MTTPKSLPQSILANVESHLKAGESITLADIAPHRAEALGAFGRRPVKDVVGGELLLRAPKTWGAEPPIDLEGLDETGRVALRELGADLAAVIPAFRVLRMLLDERAFAVFAAGVNALGGKDAGRARKLISDVLDRPPDEQLPAGFASPAIFTPKIFEETLHAWSRSIRTVAESLYVPFLMVAVDLSRLAKGERGSTWRQPPVLGAVLKAALSEWDERDVRRSLVDDRVRLIRNADAHCKVRLDIKKERARFGSSPWMTADEVGRVGGDLLNTWMALSGAFELLLNDTFINEVRTRGPYSGLVQHVFNPLAKFQGLPLLPLKVAGPASVEGQPEGE